MDSRCSDIMNRNVKEIPCRVLRVIHQRKKKSPSLVQLLGPVFYLLYSTQAACSRASMSGFILVTSGLLQWRRIAKCHTHSPRSKNKSN